MQLLRFHLVEDGSCEKETEKLLPYLKKLDPHHRIHFFDYDIPFNFSKINNYAVKHFANISDGIHLISPLILEPIINLKLKIAIKNQ